MSKGYKKFFKFLGIVIIIGLIYFAGYTVGHKNIEFEKGYILKIANTNLGQPSDVDFSLFWDAWSIVKNKFAGNIDTQKMIYGAICGMMNSLGDDYSLFMDPKEAKQFSEDLSGSFDGIGAELEIKDGKLVIASPLEGSPAEKAGLMANDVVVKINGEEVSKMTFNDAINKIRGDKGTDVTLTIFRDGWSDTKDFTITRDTINVPSVKWEQKGDYTYIKINQFGEDTTNLMQQAVNFVNSHSSKGIILDLRNNPGGYLDSAVDITSLFIDKGTVVIKESKDGSQEKISTTLTPKLKDKKLVVLVNGGSASSSEIMAGAIQDYKRGLLIGEKTFGKGSVQNLEPLKDGSEVRVTIAKWLTPNGRGINKQGIEPDIEVKLTEDDKNANRDPQLDRAIEELNKQNN